MIIFRLLKVRVQLIYNIALHGNQMKHLVLEKHLKVKVILALDFNLIVPQLLHIAQPTAIQQ